MAIDDDLVFDAGLGEEGDSDSTSPL